MLVIHLLPLSRLGRRKRRREWEGERQRERERVRERERERDSIISSRYSLNSLISQPLKV